MRHVGMTLLVVVLFVVVGFSQESVNFGVIPVGTTVNATYTLRNSNPFDCSIEAVDFGEDSAPATDVFIISGLELPLPIASGASVQWTVLFHPSAVTSYQEVMSIRLRCGIFTQNLEVSVMGQGGIGTQSLTDLLPDLPSSDPTDTGCGCSPEIDLVTSQLNSLTAIVQTQLAPAMQEIQTELVQLSLVSQSPIGVDVADACPGPFPTSGGQRFLDFVSAQRALAIQAALDLPLIQSDEPAQQALLEAGSGVMNDLVAELDTVTQQVLTLAPEYLPCLDSYVPSGTTDYIDAVLNVAADITTHPKLGVLFEGSGMDVAETVWDKIESWIGQIPVVGGILQTAMADIRSITNSGGDTLGLAAMLFQYEMERKLDGIIYGLFGIEIPPNATEAQLMELLRRITGDPIVARLDRLESDVADNATALDGLEEHVEEVEGIAREGLDVARDNQKEIAVLEDKLCCFIWAMNRFGQELGDALYGDRDTFSDMMPAVCSETTYSQCFAASHETGILPPEDEERDAIKPEIRALEADMVVVRNTLEEILRLLGGGIPAIDETPTFETPPPPPVITPIVTEETTVHELLLVTKKIYVYAEDTFTPTSSSDVHDVIVTTPAFDVSGWIDLTQLRVGDEFQVELTIRIDGTERDWLTTTFQGGPDSRLIYFDEISGGRTFIVGSWIRIRMTQVASADDFGTALPIGYQFIVQSQR
ncbi:hypothetical protein ACFLSG_04575 [Candidatus Bipolaricaulota bacterium]